MFLPHKAYISLNAIIKTLYRKILFRGNISRDGQPQKGQKKMGKPIYFPIPIIVFYVGSTSSKKFKRVGLSLYEFDLYDRNANDIFGIMVNGLYQLFVE